MTVAEYELHFNELIPYVPDLVKSPVDQAHFFHRGLNLDIRQFMRVTMDKPYEKVVQDALQTEELALERRRVRDASFKRKGKGQSFSQFPKRGKTFGNVGGSSSMTVMTTSSPVPQST